MTADLSDEDRGKTVVSGTERIGTVTDVRGDSVYVDPDFDHVPSQLKEEFGWGEGDEQYSVPEDAIETVRNSEVRLREEL